MFSVLGFVLPLLEGLLKQVKMPGGNAATEVVQDLEAAVEKLRKVHGTPVYKEQLEGFRAEPEWPTV